MGSINNIVRKATNLTGPYNFLSFFYDGVFDASLCLTGHNFYGEIEKSVYEFHPIDVVPDSLNTNKWWFNQVNPGVGFDGLICNDRINLYEISAKFCRRMHIPLLIVDHMGPHQSLSPVDIQGIKQTRIADKYVSTIDIAQEWHEESVLIRPGIAVKPSEKERKNQILIYGNFIPEEHGLLKEIVKEFDYTEIYGANPGLSEPIKNREEYDRVFQNSAIYINLSTNNAISPNILQAMACGCGIVTNTSPALKELLENQVNAIFINKSEDIPAAVRQLQNNPKQLSDMTKANYDIIERKFKISKFVELWSNVLYDLYKQDYK